jgi:hypothetical protein
VKDYRQKMIVASYVYRAFRNELALIHLRCHSIIALMLCGLPSHSQEYYFVEIAAIDYAQRHAGPLYV